MRVFISWSGSPSREYALFLRDWLRDVIQTLQPWMSEQDIDKGAQWFTELGDRLEETSQGIVCVTPSNVGSPFLNYEAGALAKAAGARVRPVLLGMKKSDLRNPLAAFQLTVADDEADMRKLVLSLNDSFATPLPSDLVERSFDKSWPDYLRAVEPMLEQVANDPATDGQPPDRSDSDMLQELLLTVRRIEKAQAEEPDRPPTRDLYDSDDTFRVRDRPRSSFRMVGDRPPTVADRMEIRLEGPELQALRDAATSREQSVMDFVQEAIASRMGSGPGDLQPGSPGGGPALDISSA